MPGEIPKMTLAEYIADIEEVKRDERLETVKRIREAVYREVAPHVIGDRANRAYAHLLKVLDDAAS